MTPIKITFKAGETIVVYSDDPAGFAESVGNAHTPEIRHMEYDDTNVPDTDLQEVQLMLVSGTTILCHIAKKHVAKVDFITGIAACTESLALAYAALAKREADLDERFGCVRAVINNIPDLNIRKDLHTEFLKRKTAYVSAIESLVDGVIRRPDGKN